MKTTIETMIDAYLEAVRFTEMGPDSEFEGDEEFGLSAINDVRVDIEKFLTDNRELIEDYDYSYPGYTSAQCMAHDIWFSRNHHGVGFWDRGLGALGIKLHEAATRLGENHIYRGENNLIYFE